MNNQLMTQAEVAEYLGLSSMTIHRLRKARDFPSPIAFSKGGIRYHRAEIEKWLRDRPRVDDSRRRKARGGKAALADGA